MVIVQPSVYGKDNSCTLDMADAAGKARARAVVVVDNTFTDSQLSDMHERGARGIRVNALTPAGMPLDQIQTLAKRGRAARLAHAVLDQRAAARRRWPT